MKKTTLLLITAFAAFVTTLCSAAPNVVFILADDLGINELGSYGQKLIKTPNLDRLASQGMRLTRHYSGIPT